MSIADYLKTALSIFYRRKKKTFYFLIFSLCVILTMGILTFSSNLMNYINNNITKNMGFRTLLVSPKTAENEDLDKAELLDIAHVDEVYSSKYNSILVDTNLKNNYLDGQVELLYGSSKILPNIINGREFMENERNVVICPVNFYPDSSINEYRIKKDNMMNGNALLGKKIVIKYYTYTWDKPSIEIDETFEKIVEVIGVYDNDIVMNLNNQCYMPSQDLIEIIDTSVPNMEEEGVSVGYSLSVVVDKIDNIEYVLKRAKDLHYWEPSFRNNFDSRIVNGIQIAALIILTLVIFATTILSLTYIKKKILSDKAAIGILRASGYNKKVVKNLYFIEFLLINLISFIIGLIIFLLLFLIIKKTLLVSILHSGLIISLNIWILLISIILTILFPMIVSMYEINKEVKLKIADLFKSGVK